MFDIVAVATVDEGVNIRNVGYEKEIFVYSNSVDSLKYFVNEVAMTD